MKIALLGDLHFSASNGNLVIQEHQEKFFSEVFFPYLIKHNIEDVIQLGDIFDRPKGVDNISLYNSKRFFFNKFEELEIDLECLIGNHDISFKTSLEINTPELVLGDCLHVHIYRKPEKLFFLDCTIDIIPWICKDNEDEILEFISKSTSEICCGHFELANFPMYRGIDNKLGRDKDFLKKYKKVFSGHYHTASNKGNIFYINTPYQLTWADSGDKKGFTVLDTETLETTFIENPYTLFNKIEYTDDKIDVDLYKNTFVKVITTGKTDKKFDKFMEKLNSVNPSNVNVIEESPEELLESDVDVSEIEDTISIIHQYIDGIDENHVDKDKVKHNMNNLYKEANGNNI